MTLPPFVSRDTKITWKDSLDLILTSTSMSGKPKSKSSRTVNYGGLKLSFFYAISRVTTNTFHAKYERPLGGHG